MYAVRQVIVSTTRAATISSAARVVVYNVRSSTKPRAIMLVMIDLSERTKEQRPDRRVSHILHPG